MQIDRVDIGEYISNKAVQYTVYVMFHDGNKDTFHLYEITSIRLLKERINKDYKSNIKASDIYFFAHGADQPYQVME